MDAEKIDLVRHMVDAVDAAFLAEAESLTGHEMLARAEKTNHILRTSWAIVRAALPERAA